MAQLVAQAKADPNALSYASAGVGTTPHLAAELFRQTAGSSMTHVPYPGGGPAITSVLAGQTQFVFTSLLPVQAFLKAGRMRALGIAAEARSPVLPAVPTFSEQGIPLVTGTWFGVVTSSRRLVSQPANRPAESASPASERAPRRRTPICVGVMAQ